MKQEPGGGPLTPLSLAIAIARLNTRIRNTGVSSREFWTQRNQYTHEQIPFSDQDILIKKYHIRSENHTPSEISKHKSGKFHKPSRVCVGDLVYVISDKDKLRARNRYLVTSVDGQWCVVKKFVGNQLRANSYKIKCDECYLVPNECASFSSRRLYEAHESGDEDEVISAPEPTSIQNLLLIHPLLILKQTQQKYPFCLVYQSPSLNQVLLLHCPRLRLMSASPPSPLTL